MSKKVQEERYTSYITLVVAPDIPEPERQALEAHWRAAELDHDYTVVLNYECRADQITILPDSKLLVIAPGLPTKEVRKLSKMIAKARRAKRQADRLVVTNYECRIDATA